MRSVSLEQLGNLSAHVWVVIEYEDNGEAKSIGFQPHAIKGNRGDVSKMHSTVKYILSSTVPATVPGKTVASPLLQRDILQLILALDDGLDIRCNQRKIVNTEILIAPASANSFTAVERWTLDRCGKPISYKVTMNPSPRGGTDFSAVSE